MPVHHGHTPDERAKNAIIALLDDVEAAWAAHDAERLAQAFAEDAIFVAFNGTRLFGRAAIAAFHVSPFAGELSETRLQIDLVEMRALSEGVTLVATSGGPIWPGSDRGVQETQTFICRNDGDRWTIVSFQNTPVRPLRPL